MVKGTIASFDPTSKYGTLFVEGGTMNFFHQSYFHSGRPPRAPKQGEEVEIVLNHENHVVEVRAVS